MKFALSAFLFFFTLAVFAQDEDDDLLSLIDEEEETVNFTAASFKTNRIVNSHSLENTANGVLDFKISHRFGFVNTGLYEMFGLDNAQVRIGLDYGVNDHIQIGIGRSGFQKMYDGYLKAKLLRQSTGARNMPVTLTYLGAASFNSLRENIIAPDLEGFELYHRISYVHQFIVGRKFNDRLTLQLMPTLLHRNLTAAPEFENTVFAVGSGGRFKVTKRIAVTGEYYYVLPDQINTDLYTNSAAIGVDIETGGHVFQLHVTNSTAMFENGFITQTVGNPFDGDLHFGFNISRVFTIKKPKEFTEDDW